MNANASVCLVCGRGVHRGLFIWGLFKQVLKIPSTKLIPSQIIENSKNEAKNEEKLHQSIAYDSTIAMELKKCLSLLPKYLRKLQETHQNNQKTEIF